jgi:hypothetical protein
MAKLYCEDVQQIWTFRSQTHKKGDPAVLFLEYSALWFICVHFGV